jgi:hypothetical protein
MKKKNGLMITGILILLALFTSPLWLWQLKPTEELNVLIVDKTVPDESYREHKGLVWLLNHFKLKKSGNEVYDLTEDYVGFVPSKEPPDFTVTELPDDLSPYEILYIADGYGVYEEEYVGGNLEGNRSELLYGGMTSAEVNRMKSSLVKNGQTLIAEFNTFGSPTEQQVKEQFYELLNIKWTGWMGRYFHDLSNNEVPVWLKHNYEKQYEEPYAFEGNGLVFVNEEDQVVVLNGEQLGSKHPMFRLTDKGLSEYSLDQDIQYNYWFDVVAANDEEEVQGYFELDLTQKGENILQDYQIPLSFPAVIHHENASYDSYYFAGDFADQDKVPNLYQLSGLSWFHQFFAFEKNGRTDTFFWKAYVPMMKQILTERDSKVSNKESVAAPRVTTEAGLKVMGKAGDEYLQVYRDGTWEDLLIKGVNMGIANPGSFPGETKISKDEYARWFEQISEMNANTVRVYTIHPPAFYEALYEHNHNRKDPIYLFQGVWVNEETFLDKKNAYDPLVMDEFKAEIKRTVDLIHANAEIEERSGHASGHYDYDVSPYLLGWVLGVEWDPEAVVGTNETNPTRTNYDGMYFRTDGVTPFETWLAEVMDYTAIYEAEQYGWQHPMSFTNWVTTDLLEHPAEPSETEDMVSVNPNVIQAKDSFVPGLFASYHIYPYYPDFLNYEEKYVDYVDHRGEKNNYAGYLQDMKVHHQMPLLVAEFGLPASRGLTHENVYGYDQGQHSEQEQGRLLTKLYEDIVEEKMAGGLVFAWHDEWFKRTWNTMDYDNPDRRPFWDNIQTNEQHFGLLSFEPDTKETQLHVDGDVSDWEARNAEPIYSGTEGPVKNVYMASDARALYIRVDYAEEQWNDQVKTSILLNTIANQGQSTIPGVPSFAEEGIDFLVQLNGTEKSRVLIDSYYDTFYYHYGHGLNMVESRSYANKKNNGIYHPIRFVLNKELTINQQTGPVTIPFSDYETGKLQYGIGNPDSDKFNSLSDFYQKDGILEVRLPWLLLNVKDPSKREIMGDIWSEKGIASSVVVDSISAAVIVTDGKQALSQRVPSASRSWMNYTWETWDEPVYYERLKKSYYILQDTFGGVDQSNSQ